MIYTLCAPLGSIVDATVKGSRKSIGTSDSEVSVGKRRIRHTVCDLQRLATYVLNASSVNGEFLDLLKID